MKTISIIIPVYYNEQSLPLLFTELLKIEQKLLKKEIAMELIFVDDGSGDNSMKELLKIKQQRENTKVIKLTRNFGSIHASKTAFKFVTGDCFLMLAADLQDPPSLILEMVDKWLNGAKFVICERETRQDPITSKVFSYIYYKLVCLFVIKNYPSGGFDLMLMDKTLLPYLQKTGKNINTALFAYWLGFEPQILYYERDKRIHGKSRWTISKKIKFFIDSLLGFSIVPIRLISVIGIIVSLIGFIYGLFIVINSIFGNIPVAGFATIVALISFLLGLIIIMLGIIGEYIWRIFDEVNYRPESVIDEIY